MGARTICVVLLLSCLPGAGCGTVANLSRSVPEEGARAPFGGIRQDLWCIQKAATGEFGLKAHPKSESEQYPQMALMLLCAADLPFSLIGDIATWPYTASFTFINQPTPVPPMAVVPPPPPQTLPYSSTVPLMTAPVPPLGVELPPIPGIPPVPPAPLPQPKQLP
jgi:hypothetical protein